MTVVCPNCGNEITAPKRKKKSVKCPYCDMDGLELGLDYFDEEDNPRQFSLINFATEHPKTTRAALIGLATAARTLAWWMENKELFADEVPSESAPIVSTSRNAIPEETTQVVEPAQESTPPLLDSSDYDSVLRKHNLSFRNLGESRFRSQEKEKQVIALGMKGLDPHITVVNSFDQHHKVKKQQT